MKKLDVVFTGWGERWTLGTLADNGRSLLFEYSPAALQRGIEFSPRHLKLRADAYQDFPEFQQRLPGLIADALPDGWGLLLMDRLFRQNGVHPERLSPLDRLAFIADRAIGALSFEPADKQLLSPQDLELLGLARDSRVIIEDASSPALKLLALLGGSPQGARPKVLVQFDPATGGVSSDPAAAGTPWMVKFQARGEHKEVCAIECCYAELLRRCGQEMPATHHFDLDAQLAGFGIERFDRLSGLRIPLHTLAGALHADIRYPSLDYSTALRATRLFTRDEREVEKAFERCVINVILHNRDDHARNFAFRMNQAWQWKLAPCYDVTFSAGPGGEHQMAVMGEGRAPGKEHLLRLARDASLDLDRARRAIARIADVAGEFKSVAGSFPIRPATIRTIAAAVEANRIRMA